TFLPVLPGSYTIQENLAQLPANWQFSGIQCTTSGPGTSATTHANGSVDITVALGGSVDCTFTNTATADLKISKTASPSPVAAGATLTYTITGNNLSGSDAQDVAVSDPLPAGAQFVSCTASQGTCVNNAGIVQADLGTITAHGQATITLVVTAPPIGPYCPGTIVNTASVTGSNESNQNNDEATAQTACVQPASITVDKVTGAPGDPTAFTFTATGGNGFTVTFALTDTAPPHTSAPLSPASYTITEQAVAGWVTGAFCTGGPVGARAAHPPRPPFDPQPGAGVFRPVPQLQVRPAARK